MVRVNFYDFTPQGRSGIPEKVWMNMGEDERQIFLRNYDLVQAEEVHQETSLLLAKLAIFEKESRRARLNVHDAPKYAA